MKKIRHQNEDTAKTKEIKLNQVILVNVKHLIGLIVQMEIFLPLIFDIFFLISFFLYSTSLLRNIMYLLYYLLLDYCGFHTLYKVYYLIR